MISSSMWSEELDLNPEILSYSFHLEAYEDDLLELWANHNWERLILIDWCESFISYGKQKKKSSMKFELFDYNLRFFFFDLDLNLQQRLRWLDLESFFLFW